MSLFSKVNAAYARALRPFFTTQSPPTRACVSCHLPSDLSVVLDVIACSRGQRETLHVQSLSYWAPANIGPYSQAVTVRQTSSFNVSKTSQPCSKVDNRTFISGQIGLIPATLDLPNPREFALECALSCQHARRIANATPGKILEGGICWLTDPSETAWRQSMQAWGMWTPNRVTHPFIPSSSTN